MAWRLTDWLRGDSRSVDRQDDNAAAVATVLALSFGLVMSAFAGPEFEQSNRVAKMFDKP